MEKGSLKKAIVDNILSYHKKYPFVVFYNYSNLDSESVFQLKKKLKTKDAFWKVCKNSLVKKALPWVTNLKNNNSLVFCSNQKNTQFEVLDILYDFAKKSEMRERIQGGVEDDKLLDSQTLENWATLPDMETLMNQICFYLFFPLVELIFILKKIEESQH